MRKNPMDWGVHSFVFALILIHPPLGFDFQAHQQFLLLIKSFIITPCGHRLCKKKRAKPFCY